MFPIKVIIYILLELTMRFIIWGCREARGGKEHQIKRQRKKTRRNEEDDSDAYCSHWGCGLYPAAIKPE